MFQQRSDWTNIYGRFYDDNPCGHRRACITPAPLKLLPASSKRRQAKQEIHQTVGCRLCLAVTMHISAIKCRLAFFRTANNSVAGFAVYFHRWLSCCFSECSTVPRFVFKIQMDKSKWNIQTKMFIQFRSCVATLVELIQEKHEWPRVDWNGSVSKWQTVQLTVL